LPPSHNAGAFDDDDIIHVEGDVNPARDLQIIDDELRLKDIEYMSELVVRPLSARNININSPLTHTYNIYIYIYSSLSLFLYLSMQNACS
jgi:ribosome-binding ATPase YchF (GTP1/OBG family)